VLLSCQPLTDDACDDVLGVIEGIASERVIELMQEEKGIRERYGLDKKKYNQEGISKMSQIGKLNVPKGIAGETTMKMTHKEVVICRRYVLHKKMCI
jgi:hypothetical protein